MDSETTVRKTLDEVRVDRSVENTRWTPLYEAENKGGNTAKWMMRCSCGTEKIVSLSNYRSGKSLSCGCYRIEVTKSFYDRPHTLPPGESARNHLILVYKRGARTRGLTYSLSVEQFTQLTQSNCHYCGVAPSRKHDRTKHGTNGVYTYNGIDRKDSSVGYEPDNCVPACSTCNLAKRSSSYEDFMLWIQNLISYRTSIGD